MSSVRSHFDEISGGYDRWRARAGGYAAEVRRIVAEIIPRRRRVVEVGVGPATVLAALRPATGLGPDISPGMVRAAAAKYPDLRFCVHDIMDGPLEDRLHYVVV